jgi:hypothetical protein
MTWAGLRSGVRPYDRHSGDSDSTREELTHANVEGQPSHVFKAATKGCG